MGETVRGAPMFNPNLAANSLHMIVEFLINSPPTTFSIRVSQEIDNSGILRYIQRPWTEFFHTEKNLS